MKNIIWILIAFCVNISVASSRDEGSVSNDNEAFAETGCHIDCLFGSCSCTCHGAGCGCACLCFWGFPECGGGGGGKGSMNSIQSMHADAIRNLISKFESEAGIQLQSLLDQYIEIMKNKEESFDVVENIRKNLVELRQEEKDEFNDYLISNGVTDIIK